MDGDVNIDALAFSKFAVGQPVPRTEDPVLLRGEGAIPTMSACPARPMR